jgi:hypothetical protein
MTKDLLKQVITAIATDDTAKAESLFKEAMTSKMRAVAEGRNEAQRANGKKMTLKDVVEVDAEAGEDDTAGVALARASILMKIIKKIGCNPIIVAGLDDFTGSSYRRALKILKTKDFEGYAETKFEAKGEYDQVHGLLRWNGTQGTVNIDSSGEDNGSYVIVKK